MAAPEQREQEAAKSDGTKFEEQIDEYREQQHEAAKRIAEPLKPQDDEK